MTANSSADFTKAITLSPLSSNTFFRPLSSMYLPILQSLSMNNVLLDLKNIISLKNFNEL